MVTLLQGKGVEYAREVHVPDAPHALSKCLVSFCGPAFHRIGDGK
jgi:hypothetical protein